jgi:hypothetical protein
MDKFPDLEETSDLELLRTRKELAELKSKLEHYEQILRENDLLDSTPTVTLAEKICVSQLEKYNEACLKGSLLTLEETKIVDLLVKNLLLARGKQVPVEKDTKKKKEDKVDIATLLKLAKSDE